jgi:prevent-host-death family protein
MSTAEARNNQAQLLRAVRDGGRVKITRYNQTIAVLVSKQDLARLEACEKDHARPAPRRKR